MEVLLPFPRPLLCVKQLVLQNLMRSYKTNLKKTMFLNNFQILSFLQDMLSLMKKNPEVFSSALRNHPDLLSSALKDTETRKVVVAAYNASLKKK